MSQITSQISPVQQYSQTSTVGRLPAYAGYAAAPNSASSHGSREYEYGEETERPPDIGAEPSLQLARDTWWDALLSLYSRHTHPQLSGGAPLTPGIRDTLSQQVTGDLRFLFRASNYWFAFFNVPRFFARLCDPSKRSSLQPSLVLAALAAANFIRSSEQESGEAGRMWALTLLEQAQASLESSINARWIDEHLVQASWVSVLTGAAKKANPDASQLIAFFEISPHPKHNALRVRGALSMLDSFVRSLAMTALDRGDHRASRFAARAVPAISSNVDYSATAGGTWDVRPTHPHAHLPPNAFSPNQSPTGQHECSCVAYTLGNNWSHAQDLTPLWLMTPAWNEEASDAEIRKEECRRLVWSAVMMVAGYTSFTAANNVMPTVDLTLMEPSNVRRTLISDDPVLIAPSSTHYCSPEKTSCGQIRAVRTRFGHCTCVLCCCGTAVCECGGILAVRKRRRLSSLLQHGWRPTRLRRHSMRIHAALRGRSCSRGGNTCSSTSSRLVNC